MTCPKCGGLLTVDDVDTTLLAAQLRCPHCFLTFLQRLRDGREPSRKVRMHRWTNPAAGGAVTAF